MDERGMAHQRFPCAVIWTTLSQMTLWSCHIFGSRVIFSQLQDTHRTCNRFRIQQTTVSHTWNDSVWVNSVGQIVGTCPSSVCPLPLLDGPTFARWTLRGHRSWHKIRVGILVASICIIEMGIGYVAKWQISTPPCFIENHINPSFITFYIKITLCQLFYTPDIKHSLYIII